MDGSGSGTGVICRILFCLPGPDAEVFICAVCYSQSRCSPASPASPPRRQAGAASASGSAADAAYEKVAATILDDLYARNPSYATDLGLHQYDSRLDNFSRAAVQDEVAAVARFKVSLEAIDPKSLSLNNRLDREMLLLSLESRRIGDEEIRSWARDPDNYSSGITNSAFSLIKRDFAPAAERLKSLIAREKGMPAALREARRNLDNPPRIYTEIAIEQLDGNIGFFKTVVEAFADVKDPALLAEFKKTNDAVIAALGDYKAWLQKDLLPRSNGNYAYGADTLPPQAAGRRDDRHAARRAAADGRGQPQAESGAVRGDGAAASIRRSRRSRCSSRCRRIIRRPTSCSSTTQAELDAIGRFMTDKHIVTIPRRRAGAGDGDAAVHARDDLGVDGHAGAVREGRLRGFYNMTLPDPTWNAARDRGVHAAVVLRRRSRTSRCTRSGRGTTCSSCTRRPFPSDVRKVFGATSNSEGWAHYCEQMVIDEGFHAAIRATAWRSCRTRCCATPASSSASRCTRRA